MLTANSTNPTVIQEVLFTFTSFILAVSSQTQQPDSLFLLRVWHSGGRDEQANPGHQH